MSEHYCSDCGCQSEHKIRDWWENRSRLAWRFRRLISFRRRRRAERERAAHRADVHDGGLCDCPVPALPTYIDSLFRLTPYDQPFTSRLTDQPLFAQYARSAETDHEADLKKNIETAIEDLTSESRVIQFRPDLPEGYRYIEKE